MQRIFLMACVFLSAARCEPDITTHLYFGPLESHTIYHYGKATLTVCEPFPYAAPVWGVPDEDIISLGNLPTNELAYDDYRGVTNTRAIIDELGYGNYAAKLCDDLIAVGYDDWYLPAAGELYFILEHDAPTTYFEKIRYWSSSEVNSSYAWSVEYTTSASLEITDKSQIMRCMCAR